MVRAWLCLAFGSDRQYAGNQGYPEELSKSYKYDSFVANHLQVQEGDIFFLRSRDRFLGTAVVMGINSSAGTKTILRCPECNSTGIKRRATKIPRFRCNEGHEFDAPVEDRKACTQFEAFFGESFRPPQELITVDKLRQAVLRQSDQLSIQELNVELVRSIADRLPPSTQIGEKFGAEYTDISVAPSTRERTPFDVDPDAVDRATSAHATLQNLLADALKKAGIGPKRPEPLDPQFDIGWQHDNKTFICEVKSLTERNEEKQLRYAIGQVLRYQHALLARGLDVACVLFVERQPFDYAGWEKVCSALNITLSWPERINEMIAAIVTRES